MRPTRREFNKVMALAPLVPSVLLGKEQVRFFPVKEKEAHFFCIGETEFCVFCYEGKGLDVHLWPKDPQIHIRTEESRYCLGVNEDRGLLTGDPIGNGYADCIHTFCVEGFGLLVVNNSAKELSCLLGDDRIEKIYGADYFIPDSLNGKTMMNRFSQVKV